MLQLLFSSANFYISNYFFKTREISEKIDNEPKPIRKIENGCINSHVRFCDYRKPLEKNIHSQIISKKFIISDNKNELSQKNCYIKKFDTNILTKMSFFNEGNYSHKKEKHEHMVNINETTNFSLSKVVTQNNQNLFESIKLLENKKNDEGYFSLEISNVPKENKNEFINPNYNNKNGIKKKLWFKSNLTKTQKLRSVSFTVLNMPILNSFDNNEYHIKKLESSDQDFENLHGLIYLSKSSNELFNNFELSDKEIETADQDFENIYTNSYSSKCSSELFEQFYISETELASADQDFITLYENYEKIKKNPTLIVKTKKTSVHNQNNKKTNDNLNKDTEENFYTINSSQKSNKMKINIDNMDLDKKICRDEKDFCIFINRTSRDIFKMIDFLKNQNSIKKTEIILNYDEEISKFIENFEKIQKHLIKPEKFFPNKYKSKKNPKPSVTFLKNYFENLNEKNCAINHIVDSKFDTIGDIRKHEFYKILTLQNSDFPKAKYLENKI